MIFLSITHPVSALKRSIYDQKFGEWWASFNRILRPGYKHDSVKEARRRGARTALIVIICMTKICFVHLSLKKNVNI